MATLSFFIPLLALQSLIEAGGLDAKLLYLVQMRASQITAAHTVSICTARTRVRRGRRSKGCTALRRGAIRRTTTNASGRRWSGLEAVTLVAATGFATMRCTKSCVRNDFGTKRYKTLKLAVATINLWNQSLCNVSMRTVPGDIQAAADVSRDATTGLSAGMVALRLFVR